MSFYGTDYPEPHDPGPDDNYTTYAIGTEVTHRTFGDGLVIDAGETHGEQYVTVDFHTVGTKKLLPRVSPLTQRPTLGDGDKYETDIMEEMRKLRVRKAAADAFKREQIPPGEPFDAGLLSEMLARPKSPPMRVDGLIPTDGSALIVAQRKTGKTTLVLNYARSLILGEPLLGMDVRPLQGRVGFLNFEVSGETLTNWADDHKVPHERFYQVNLRGRRNPFACPEDRERLAALLRSHEVEALVIDPFGRAYPGTSQNDPGEVQAFLTGLDSFARAEAGATDLVLTAHAGWNGERARGASSLEDWADAVVTMTRDPDDETQRFLRAIGRDIEIEEDRLSYDHETRTLSLTGTGSRHAAKTDRKLAELSVHVLRAARTNPGLNLASLETAVKEDEDAPSFRNGDVSKAAQYARERGWLSIVRGGSGRGNAYTVTDSQPLPTPPRECSKTPPTPP